MNRPTNQFVRKRVAIVGSGSAGIGALWALNRTYHDVYLYESADRLGGHINTVQWETGRYKTAVDTGFIVLNTATHCKLTCPFLNQTRSDSYFNSELHYSLEQDRRRNRSDSDDTWCISRPRDFRMGQCQFESAVLSEEECFVVEDVDVALRNCPLQSVCFGLVDEGRGSST